MHVDISANYEITGINPVVMNAVHRQQNDDYGNIDDTLRMHRLYLTNCLNQSKVQDGYCAFIQMCTNLHELGLKLFGWNP